MLEIDQQLINDLEIDPAYDLPLEADITDKDTVTKIGYLNEQIKQLQGVIWRLRVDYMVMSAADADTPQKELEKRNKIAEFTAQLAQYYAGMVTMIKLRDELEG